MKTAIGIIAVCTVFNVFMQLAHWNVTTKILENENDVLRWKLEMLHHRADSLQKTVTMLRQKQHEDSIKVHYYRKYGGKNNARKLSDS